MDSNQLRAVLVTQRRVVGWSQEQLAEHSTISVRTIRNLEKGVIRTPRRTSVELLLGALRSAASGCDTALFSATATADSPRPVPARYFRAALCADIVGVPNHAKWVGLRPKSDVTVGRQADLMHVVTTIQRGKPLVLTGPVGVGKTRLALEAAARLLDQFPDGVAVVELGSLTPEHVDGQAATVEVRRAVEEVIACEAGAGGEATDRQQLLVIDNAEHVLGVVTTLLSRLLQQYPGLHVLITSLRAPTAIPVDIWEVGALSVDQPAETWVHPAAAELFRLRVRSTVPTLDLGDRMPGVVRLCRRLGGLPLAIEIAAFRLRSVPLDVMLAEEEILSILDQNDAGGLSHHRTLLRSVEWAYGLLDERQREVLRGLARFPETFTIDDVLDSAAEDGRLGSRGINVLADLVDVSAVQVRRGRQYVYEVPRLMRDYVNSIAA